MADKPSNSTPPLKFPAGPVRQQHEYATTGKVPPGPTPNRSKPGV